MSSSSLESMRVERILGANEKVQQGASHEGIILMCEMREQSEKGSTFWAAAEGDPSAKLVQSHLH